MHLYMQTGQTPTPSVDVYLWLAFVNLSQKVDQNDNVMI